MNEVQEHRTATLAEPLSFIFPDSKVLYADQMEARVAGIQDLVLLFAPPPRTTSRSTSSGRSDTLLTYLAHAPYRDTVAYGVGARKVNRPASRRVRIHAIRYNSPLEIIIEIPFPLLATGSATAVAGSGLALVRFWKKFNEARVAYHEGNTAISKARAQRAAWDALRQELDLPEESRQLPKDQRQRVNAAIKLVTAVEDMKVLEK